MRKTSACIVVLASLLVSGVASAKICKTVGPDGSVTYTDRPGVDTCAIAEEQPAQTKPGAASAKKAASPAQAPAVAEPAATSGPASTADVEKSVLAILDLEERAVRAYDFCAQVQPSSIRRYGDATDGWRERNVAATIKMHRALAETFNGEQQRIIREGVKQRYERQMAPVAKSAKDAQTKWCDQTMTEIENRGLDIKPELVAPLLKN